VPLLRSRLLLNAVTFRFSVRKKLKFDDNTENKTEELLLDSCSDKVAVTSVYIFSDIDYQCDPDKNIVDILLDHNYSAKPNDNLNMSTTIKEQSNSISFNELNTLDLHLSPNWHKYFSYEKKFFGISEIIFVEKE
ncbi:Uncharacterized protein FWK35_00027841, partial [Aphis craccivora]